MIVDSSALVAILKEEQDNSAFASAMGKAATLSMSAASYLETAIVTDRVRPIAEANALDELIEGAGIAIVAVSLDQAREARRAYSEYGRGSGHPAKLNFGDCFSYALAKGRDEPLLFKGDDFAQTDIEPALKSG